jgi:2',5'-phosphodiesterase
VRPTGQGALRRRYAASDYAQTVLFGYCPKPYLDYEYRKQLVLQELQRYQADLICLQEVDDKAFSEYLAPQLVLDGYKGRYTNKTGRVREGSATFWRSSRFALAAQRDVLLRQAFAQPLPALHAQFAPMLEASPHLAEALQKVGGTRPAGRAARTALRWACPLVWSGAALAAATSLPAPPRPSSATLAPWALQVTTVAQITLLVPVDGGGGGGSSSLPLAVVNTHLFYHPYAPHIRSMHTAAILEELQDLLQRCAVDAGAAALLKGRRPAVMFCGDLNSDLNDGVPGVVQLLREGTLPAGYWDWVDGAAFRWGHGEEDGGEAQQAAKAVHGAAGGAAAAGVALPPQDGHDFEPAGAAPRGLVEVVGVDISAPFALRSADDLATPYTNYTSGYVALLDYVWYEEARLRVLGCPVPVPERALLQETFIPSRAFPSDHLAVVYDLEFKQQA